MAISTGFSRLKGIFSSSLNLTTYKDIVSAAKNAECGKLPKDLISIILNKGATGAKQQEIAELKQAFADASDVLSQGISVNQRAISIKMHRVLESAFNKEKIISLDFLKDIRPTEEMLNPKACTRGIESASKALTEKFSKIMPDCARVEIKPIGVGSYGQCYKLEFLDSSGNKLVHDKVLKVFYNEEQTHFGLMAKMQPVLAEKSKEFASQFTLRDIVRLWNNIKSITVEDVITFLKPYEEILTKQGVTIKPEEIEKGLSKLKSTKLKDIKPILAIIKSVHSAGEGMKMEMPIFNKLQENMAQVHGVYAEANTMMFLKSRVGHSLRKTNVVAPNYYDVKKGFSVAEFSDELLPVSKSDVNFGLLGLEHEDLHKANLVAGKIIDIGGIRLTRPELGDKITARYYKKIMNQKNPELRKKYIEQLEKEIELMNELDGEKVRRAINLAA